MSKIFKPRRGTTYTMTQTDKRNTVLAKGEFFVEVPNTGIGTGPSIIKIGDGVKRYEELPIALSGTDTSDVSASTATTVAAALSNVVSGAKISTLFGELKKALSLTLSSVNEVTGNVEFPLTIQNNKYGYKRSDGAFIPFVTVSDVNAGLNAFVGTAPITVSEGVVSHNDSGVSANTYGPSADTTGANGTVINIPQITVDAKGHVTRVVNRKFTAVNTTEATVYTGSSPISINGSNGVVSHNNSGVSAGTYGPGANVTGNNGATINIPQITVDAKGHVTSVINRVFTAVNTSNASVSVIDNLTSTSTTAALSARQGTLMYNQLNNGALQPYLAKGLNHTGMNSNFGGATQPIYLNGAGNPVLCSSFVPTTGGTFSNTVYFINNNSNAFCADMRGNVVVQNGNFYARNDIDCWGKITVPKVKCSETVQAEDHLIAGGSDAGIQGSVRFYDPYGKYVKLQSGSDIGANIAVTLPSSKGTLALASSSSSRRIKENIHDMTEERAKKLLDLNIVNFDYKDKWCGGLKDQSGVIAEDTIDIIPEAVDIPEDYDSDKPLVDINSSVPGVDYRQFIPYLIKMVQIQQKEIDELKAELKKK